MTNIELQIKESIKEFRTNKEELQNEIAVLCTLIQTGVSENFSLIELLDKKDQKIIQRDIWITVLVKLEKMEANNV